MQFKCAVGAHGIEAAADSIPCQVCRDLLQRTAAPFADALQKINEAVTEEAGPQNQGCSAKAATTLKNRLQALQMQEGIRAESTRKGRRSSAQRQDMPLHCRLHAWLDARRAGVYKKVKSNVVRCVHCNVCIQTVRDSTIFFILQHECSDEHWHFFHQNQNTELHRSPCNGVLLHDRSGGTLAHEELESFQLWLSHGAPWNVSIGHRCSLQDIV